MPIKIEKQKLLKPKSSVSFPLICLQIIYEEI